VNSWSIYALDCTPDGTVIAFNGPEGCVAAIVLHVLIILSHVCTRTNVFGLCCVRFHSQEGPQRFNSSSKGSLDETALRTLLELRGL
jgi:hypothetical protein